VANRLFDSGRTETDKRAEAPKPPEPPDSDRRPPRGGDDRPLPWKEVSGDRIQSTAGATDSGLRPEAPTRLAEHGGLDGQERRTVRLRDGSDSEPAHALTEHGPLPDGPTDAELRGPVEERKKLRNAQFFDRAQMEEAAEKTMEVRGADIDAWKASAPAGRRKAFDADPGLGNLGHGYEQVGDEVQPIEDDLPGCRVVLNADGKGDYTVHTVFPITERGIKR